MSDQQENGAEAGSNPKAQRFTIDIKVLIPALAASLLMTSLFCLFILLIFFRPNWIFNYGLVSKYFITNPTLLAEANLKNLLPLISNGTIMSLNDLWSFQNGLYQTIITVLIGVNAVLATLSFFMIRNSSGNAAREEAAKEVERHIVSQSFNKKVKKAIHKKVNAAQIDYDFMQDQMNTILKQIESAKEELAAYRLESVHSAEKIDRVTSQIEIIASEISALDRTESDFVGSLSSKDEEE